MKIVKERIGLNKIYRRRDNYELRPEYQREDDIWSEEKEQKLLDTVLKNWTIPKIIFKKVEEDSFECVDGQQRLNAIFKFFDGELALSRVSGIYKDLYYNDLPNDIKDIFDDFELDVDTITEATEDELRELFIRLQLGASLNSAERLNAKLGNMRDFVKKRSEHPFFAERIPLKNTRYAFQAICAQICLLEKEGIKNTKLQDLSNFYDREIGFDTNSREAKKVTSILNQMYNLFDSKTSIFKNRASIISFYLLLSVIFDKGVDLDEFSQKVKRFFGDFQNKLKSEIEKGANAMDTELIVYQSKVNQAADSKDSIKKRDEILKRRIISFDSSFVDIFTELDARVIEIYKKEDIRKISESILNLIIEINKIYFVKNNVDLFKPTTELVRCLSQINTPTGNQDDFKNFIDSLYKIFYEGSGSLGRIPVSLVNEDSIFMEIKHLRTGSFHDYEHGSETDILQKKEKIRVIYKKYSEKDSLEEIQEVELIHLQRKILEKIRNSLIDLRKVI